MIQLLYLKSFKTTKQKPNIPYTPKTLADPDESIVETHPINNLWSKLQIISNTEYCNVAFFVEDQKARGMVISIWTSCFGTPTLFQNENKENKRKIKHFVSLLSWFRKPLFLDLQVFPECYTFPPRNVHKRLRREPEIILSILLLSSFLA